MLRIATVIRAAGWLVAVASLAIGLISGIGQGWQFPPQPPRTNVFDQFDDPKGAGPWTEYPKREGKRTFSYEEARRGARIEPGAFDDLIPREKQFQIQSVQLGYMLAGFLAGAALLGLAYVFAWVIAGFAPGN